MKVLVAVVLACALSANAQTVKLAPGDACPAERPALFMPEPEAVRQAGELAAARAERDALKDSHLDGRKVAVLVVGAILFGAASAAAVAVGVSEATKKN